MNKLSNKNKNTIIKLLDKQINKIQNKYEVYIDNFEIDYLMNLKIKLEKK